MNVKKRDWLILIKKDALTPKTYTHIALRMSSSSSSSDSDKQQEIKLINRPFLC